MHFNQTSFTELKVLKVYLAAVLTMIIYSAPSHAVSLSPLRLYNPTYVSGSSSLTVTGFCLAGNVNLKLVNPDNGTLGYSASIPCDYRGRFSFSFNESPKFRGVSSFLTDLQNKVVRAEVAALQESQGTAFVSWAIVDTTRSPINYDTVSANSGELNTLRSFFPKTPIDFPANASIALKQISPGDFLSVDCRHDYGTNIIDSPIVAGPNGSLHTASWGNYSVNISSSGDITATSDGFSLLLSNIDVDQRFFPVTVVSSNETLGYPNGVTYHPACSYKLIKGCAMATMMVKDWTAAVKSYPKNITATGSLKRWTANLQSMKCQ